MSDRRTSCRMIAPLACAVVCCLIAVLDAEDWPQWRGIDRAAVWHETGIVERFAEDGLIVKWRTPVRAGFAGPAVADGRVFVLDYQETPRTPWPTTASLCRSTASRTRRSCRASS